MQVCVRVYIESDDEDLRCCCSLYGIIIFLSRFVVGTSAVGKLSREKERKKERAHVVKRTNSRKQLYEKREEEEEEGNATGS